MLHDSRRHIVNKLGEHFHCVSFIFLSIFCTWKGFCRKKCLLSAFSATTEADFARVCVLFGVSAWGQREWNLQKRKHFGRVSIVVTEYVVALCSRHLHASSYAVWYAKKLPTTENRQMSDNGLADCQYATANINNNCCRLHEFPFTIQQSLSPTHKVDRNGEKKVMNENWWPMSSGPGDSPERLSVRE